MLGTYHSTMTKSFSGRTHWAKLCFQSSKYSPKGEHIIVTIVRIKFVVASEFLSESMYVSRVNFPFEKDI